MDARDQESQRTILEFCLLGLALESSELSYHLLYLYPINMTSQFKFQLLNFASRSLLMSL